MEVIAKIYTGFNEKFGIPRQSGLAKSTVGKIVFEKKYNNCDAVRGLEEFKYLWLLWGFSSNKYDNFIPLVSPPRLNGEKKGVFATRSPFRPNSIGLSSVKLEKVELTKKGPIIYVSGVDMLNGTPIYDIKPYLEYVDSHVGAGSGFAEGTADFELVVEVPDKYKILPEINIICEILKQDPRASYNKKSDFVYGMNYLNYDIRFTVDGEIIKINEIIEKTDKDFTKIK